MSRYPVVPSFRFMLLLSFIVAPAMTRSAPPIETGYQPEKMDDPYIPLDNPQLSLGLRSSITGVQVNVNAGGMNILGDAANEPSLAIDPTNPLRMAIGWRQFDNVASNFRQGGYAYSTNGGVTWTFPGVLEPGVFRSDPVLAADNAGRFFYNSLLTTFCADVWQSSNAGQTWPTKVSAFGGDKIWMDVDRTAGVGSGNLYFAWQSAAVCPGQSTTLLFTRSTDHGATWMNPIAIPNSPRFGTVAVGPDGAVYVCGATSASLATQVVAKSTNAQNPGVPTWAFSVTGSFLGGSQVASGGPNPGGLSGQIWLAVNPTNAAHVFMLGSVDPAGADPLDVRFAKSVNGGQTWGPSIRVNTDASTTAYQWFGTMSVAPNGRIDVVWNDTRDDPSNATSRLYYTFSLDEGTTWATAYAVTPAWNSSVGYPNQNKIGDYYHMISDNSAANLAFAATFNNEQDVYFIKIAPNDCNRNGIPDDVDIANNTSHDCNGNNLPDECETDCNGDGIADVCQLAGNDCNGNGIPDDCDPGHEDCNFNGVFDQCEGFVDCNHNGHWDVCDINSGTSRDCNADGIPDECQVPAGAQAADVCANAVFISPGQVYFGNNSTATTDAGSGDSCGASGRDVYYRYRPISSGNLTLSLCNNTAFDTILSVHSACPATAANQLPGACDDDFCSGGGPSQISNLAVTAGTTYLIRIAGFNGGSGGDVGTFGLTLTGPTGFGDCNSNGVPDSCELAGGDANGNGIPDTCEAFPPCPTCLADMDGNNLTNVADISGFVTCALAFPAIPSNCGCADMNSDGKINGTDIRIFTDKILGVGDPDPTCP